MISFNVSSNEPHPSNTITIIGVTYDDGIILGSTDTTTQLNANVVSCHCVHETEILLKDAQNFILDQENVVITAKTIGKMLSAFNSGMKNMGQTSVIIGGGKKIFEVNDVGIVTEKSNFCVAGYGVAYLNKFLEKEWRKGMNEEEAEKLVLKTLSLNISLGGVRICGIETASVNSKGVTRVFHHRDTLPTMQEELDLEHSAEERDVLECVCERFSPCVNLNADVQIQEGVDWTVKDNS
ncbi:hypothetical protein AABB24_001877 [Solanum stoloniferum]|uniref:Uncharacterized protein n=2 Tax=Solanum TaxID=4107 RepID=A0AAF0PW45_SOLVR|nr:proteasome subunit beta type-6-like [Solanum verrucosum]WMV12088.1 hypothetical protein MTR67_005473 [Solanum verrucosum]